MTIRTLILADRSFALREHEMLRRLEIGLLDEGVRIARAVPSGCENQSSAGLAFSATYRDAGLRLIGPDAAELLHRELRRTTALSVPDSRGPLDIVHVWGDRAWGLGLDLASRTGASLAFEGWSAEAIGRVHAFEHKAHGLEASGAGGLWFAPDRVTLDALRDAHTRWPAQLSDWGVHVPAWKPLTHAEDVGISIGVMASGAEPSAVMTCLSGLARALVDREHVMVFLDEAAVRKHPAVWKHVEALRLHTRLSIVPSMESRRDPVLRTDILVQPERRGEHRTLILQAMAVGACVVAPHDPLMDCLDPERALLVDAPSPETWQAALRDVVDHADRRSSLGAAARSYITRHRLGHQHVAATLEGYRALLEDLPIPFAQAAGSDQSNAR